MGKPEFSQKGVELLGHDHCRQPIGVDLGVDECGVKLAVAQHIGDLFERSTLIKHLSPQSPRRPLTLSVAVKRIVLPVDADDGRHYVVDQHICQTIKL